MKDMPSMLLPAGIDRHNVSPREGWHKSRSSTELNMARPDLQPVREPGTAPDANQNLQPAVEQTWVLDQGVGLTLAQQAAPPSPSEDEPRVSVFSDSSSDGVTSQQEVSPRGLPADRHASTARASRPASASPTSSAGRQASPVDFTDGVAPEEVALMRNSGNYARGRRQRRGAIQFGDPPLESGSFASPSQTSSPSPDDDGTDHNAATAQWIPPSPRTPRARLQRSFAPSEREGAGAVLGPGLLRRLARPFSGPWLGPSSPLSSIPSDDVPAVGCLSGLCALFSRRR